MTIERDPDLNATIAEAALEYVAARVAHEDGCVDPWEHSIIRMDAAWAALLEVCDEQFGVDNGDVLVDETADIATIDAEAAFAQEVKTP